MRVFLGLGLVLGMACAVTAVDEKGDKIDAKKLVGKWETKNPKVQKLVIEFTDAGKVRAVASEGDKESRAEGTYKVDGNKILIDIKIGDTQRKMVRTVTKLTDTEMVSMDDAKGSEDTLVRVKEKKDDR
jgi:uncharacterized protein (TIGR03066 family)